jgi:hypothetical protein
MRKKEWDNSIHTKEISIVDSSYDKQNQQQLDQTPVTDIGAGQQRFFPHVIDEMRAGHLHCVGRPQDSQPVQPVVNVTDTEMVPCQCH